MITCDEAAVLARELGSWTDDDENGQFYGDEEEVYDSLVDRGLLYWLHGGRYQTSTDGVVALKKYIRRAVLTKTLVGYVVKVGNEYATGAGNARSVDRKKAHVFLDGNEYWSSAKKWAIAHRDRCHPGGRVVARYRYV